MSLQRESQLEELKAFCTLLPEGLYSSLVAHRGFHEKLSDDLARPIENTLSAFTTAWKYGFTLCECDVTHSACGRVVLSHDKTFKRLAMRNDEIHSTPVEELSFSTMKEKILLKDGSGILLLEDVFAAMIKLPGKKLVVEVKKTSDPDTITNGLMALLQYNECEVLRNGFVPIIMSFRPETCFLMKNKLNTSGIEEKLKPICMLLTELKKEINGKKVQTIITQDIGFDLSLPSCAELVRKLLVSDEYGSQLDGIYIEYEPEMLDDGHQVRKTILDLISSSIKVGVFFLKKGPDDLKTVRALAVMGVSFINSDVTSTEVFYAK